MPITLDLAGVSTDLEALPAGNYHVTVASVTETLSKSSSQPMLAVKLRVDEPEDLAGRMLFDNFSLQPQALWKLKRWLMVLGYGEDELGDGFVLEPDELVGLDCVAVVTTRMFVRNANTEQEEQVERNDVTAYAAADAVVGIGAVEEGDSGFEFDFD